jgi:hypothetical protein
MDRREMLGALGALGFGVTLVGTTAKADDHEPGKKDAMGPLDGGHAHFCGIHLVKGDPQKQFIVQHFCAAHSSGMFQCLLFDSAGKNAKLLGVEYIVGHEAYMGLPKEEKKYWHPHTYEVLAGGLIAPSMKPEDEMKFMKMILTTWGKTFHTWPDPKSAVPMGEPVLMWSAIADGQIQEKVLAERDKQFKVAASELRELRGKEIGYEVPSVAFPMSVDQTSRQWTDKDEDRPTPRK